MRNADRGMDQIECSLRNPQSAFRVHDRGSRPCPCRYSGGYVLDSGFRSLLSSIAMSPDFCAVTWFGQLHRFFGLDWSYLMILGFTGNLLFAMRFIVQWIASEKRGESVLPVSFWHFSIAGSILLGAYFIFRRDPVGIVSYLPNSVIYLRNLHLIRRKARLVSEPESAEVCRRSTRVADERDSKK
jgi:lipid-A-disaccharide synthase-like uncharacterized protein